MKRKAIVSVLLLCILTGQVAIASYSGSGKSFMNRVIYHNICWDEKLGDIWNIWLEECEDAHKKEMFLAAFAKIEEDMIDGSYYDIPAHFKQGTEEAITSLVDDEGTEYIFIEGIIYKKGVNREYSRWATLLIVARQDGSYEVYNDYLKGVFASYLEDEGVEFSLGYSYYVDSHRKGVKIADPLFIEYTDDTQIDDFWGKFMRACVDMDKWQKKYGANFKQIVRIGENDWRADCKDIGMRYQEITLDFSRLVEDEEDFAKLKESVQAEGLALTAQLEEEAAVKEAAKKCEIYPKAYRSYICQPGDTLWEISKKYCGSTDKILEICDRNRIADANLIYVGQRLLLPEDLPAEYQ